MDTTLVSVLANGGVAGVVLVLIILGWLVPKGSYLAMKEDRDEWRNTAKITQSALEESRQTAAVADERALVSQEMARTATQLLTGLKKIAPEGQQREGIEP